MVLGLGARRRALLRGQFTVWSAGLGSGIYALELAYRVTVYRLFRV